MIGFPLVFLTRSFPEAVTHRFEFRQRYHPDVAEGSAVVFRYFHIGGKSTGTGIQFDIRSVASTKKARSQMAS